MVPAINRHSDRVGREDHRALNAQCRKKSRCVREITQKNTIKQTHMELTMLRFLKQVKLA